MIKRFVSAIAIIDAIIIVAIAINIIFQRFVMLNVVNISFIATAAPVLVFPIV